MARTTIKQDEQGPYVRVDGWIARPVRATAFAAGDIINGSHPAGPAITVTALDRSRRERWEGEHEYWWHRVEGAHARKSRDRDRARNPGLYNDEETWLRTGQVIVHCAHGIKRYACPACRAAREMAGGTT